MDWRTAFIHMSEDISEILEKLSEEEKEKLELVLKSQGYARGWTDRGMFERSHRLVD